MKHCAYEDRLTSWLLGDLPPAEAETIRRHVAECGACRALAGELEPVVAALRQGLSEEPAKPLRLYPSRRRQVLATPYQSRFRRWWRGTHPMLRLAASLALVVGFAWMALMPAFSYRAKRAARAPMYYPYADSVECLEEVAELEEVAPPAVDAMRQPEVPAFTPDFSLSPRPPPEPLSPKPQAFETVMQIKSPLIMHGWADGASGGAESRETGASAGRKDTSYTDDDIVVEVCLDEGVTRADAPRKPAAPAPAPEMAAAPGPRMPVRSRRLEPAPESAVAAAPPQPPLPPAPRAMASPKPQARDTAMQVKSPVILRNIYGTPRRAKIRGMMVAAGGASETSKDTASKDDDIAVEVILSEQTDSPAAVGHASGQVVAGGTRQAVPPTEPAADAEEREETGLLPEEQTIQRMKAKDEAPPAARVPAAHHPFVETRANPFSTFAIDVDTASYTRTRQSLENRALPDPEAVRTEEIVNAFDYGDRAPDTAVFRVYVEGAPAPFGAGLELVRIGVKGRRLGREEQRPAMLTFLVDASGSMAQPDRIGLARGALALLLEQLAPHDRLQLIAFDDHARLLLDATPATERAAILAAFDRLQCRGSTNLEEGMRMAYAQAARAFVPGGENRVILISDGVANLGADSAADILARIDAHRRQGITCTVFGVGRGAYNDRMLEELANRGDGSYRFLDSPAEVRRAFVDDLAATLNTIATDVKIQVEWSPSAVGRYRQLGYENRALTKEQFRDDTVDAGEVGSGQSVTALYEFERVEPAPRDQPLGWVRVRYRRVDTQAIEEIERPILPRDFVPRIEAARPGLRLAACAAEFAELLRRSPHAAGSRFADVSRLLRPVALEMKLDTRVAELVRLVELAGAISD